MKYLIPFLLLLASCASTSTTPDGWTPLFNGENLDGWVLVNTAEETWQVEDGMIVCSGVPIGLLRTDRMYENYILELEYRHMKDGGNAGLFVHSDALPTRGQPFTRSIEVQIMDGSDPNGNWTGHGDIFSIWGAKMEPERPHPAGWERCLPSERRANPAGQWNHYRVESRDGRLTLAVNGKVVSGASAINPRKGYICLESEGSEIHFRNLKIKELPTTHPEPDEIATADEGFRPMYNGVNFRGWKWDEGHTGHWQASDWRLSYDGHSDATDKHLWTEKDYGNFTMIVDWRLPRKPVRESVPDVQPSGLVPLDADGNQKMVEVLDAGDSGIYLRGQAKSQVNIWCWPIGSGEVWGYRTDSNMSSSVIEACTPMVRADQPPGKWNRFEITMQDDLLTVFLNGKKVIDKARLPDIPASGPIALQHHGDPIHFANLYIKELD